MSDGKTKYTSKVIFIFLLFIEWFVIVFIADDLMTITAIIFKQSQIISIFKH